MIARSCMRESLGSLPGAQAALAFRLPNKRVQLTALEFQEGWTVRILRSCRTRCAEC